MTIVQAGGARRLADKVLVRAVGTAAVGELEVFRAPAPARTGAAGDPVPEGPRVEQRREKVEEDCFALQAVPPTVNPSIFSVGWPTPTGTLWPSLPQMPTPSSRARSLPTMLTRFIASGPLPISVAPFTGTVTLPSSMR